MLRNGRAIVLQLGFGMEGGNTRMIDSNNKALK